MNTSIPRGKLLALAKKYGTPLYVYDLDLVSARYKEMLGYFKHPGLRIFYAMKANHNFHVLKHLKNLGSGIDAVSPAEALLALAAGFTPKDIIYTSSSTSVEEIKKIHSLGILQNIDTLSSLEHFGRHFKGGKVCVRFNTGVAGGAHKFVTTGGAGSKFGILVQDAEKVKNIARKYKLKIIGLHEHIGSGVGEIEKMLRSMKKLLSIADKKHFPDLEFIDFGGGFKVPYTPGEKRIDYPAFGKKVMKLFSQFCKRYGRELKLYFEPGRYIAAEAGCLIIQVNTLKPGKNAIIAGTNSGFTQLIRPAFYSAYHHIVNLSNPDGNPKTYDIFGNICESGDFLAKGRKMPEVREGDYLAVLNAGAYCYSMGSVYNLRPLPGEVVVRKGKETLSRKALSPEELAGRIISESL